MVWHIADNMDGCASHVVSFWVESIRERIVFFEVYTIVSEPTYTVLGYFSRMHLRP